jgi:23S rRNA G2445 N2-methylase RlmL
MLSYFPAPFDPERNGGMHLIKNNPKIKPYPTRQKISLHKRKQWTAERFEFESKTKENPELVVYSTDINPKAPELTILNAQENQMSDRIHAYCGDVLDSIPSEIKAESIFWAMPFGLLDSHEELTGHDWQVFDPGYRAIKKFFAIRDELKKELNG